MTTRRRRIAAGAFLVATCFLGHGTLVARAQAPPPPPVPHVTATPTGPATPGEPDASPSPEPEPLASPSPTPSATPTPSASPSPSASGAARPIHIERASVGIVPGGSLGLAVSGGAGTFAVRSSGPSVDASYDPVARRLTLLARVAGSGTVTLSDTAGDTASVDVLVAPAAGIVPREVTVSLGGNVSAAFAIARANEAIAREAQLQPQAAIVVNGIAVPETLRPGDRLDVTARVKVAGANLVDALGTTTVHVRDDAYPRIDPQVLLYSDDPERLDAQTDGVLLRATLDATHPARAYVYHVSDAPARRLYLALRGVSGAARVQLLGYGAGPERAFSFVGHRSTLQYLLERGAQESVVIDVPPDRPYLIALGNRAMRAGDLVAAIYDMRLLAGDGLTVTVVSALGDRDPLEGLGDAELAGDGHGRRGTFALDDVPPIALDYTIGAAEPTPFAVGTPTLANLRAGERALGGDYGVLRGIALQVSNPTTAPATAYLYEQPAGGNATTSLWFAGDAAPTEIACVKVPTNRYAVRAITLAAGETRAIAGEYMTDGTSFFPLLFGLTATPPSPPPGPYDPDACTPKSPPVSPSGTPARS
ncbi:MAG: hypothetical protein NVS1B2_04690 [Vulcanimicrobiaceae bacterium]